MQVLAENALRKAFLPFPSDSGLLRIVVEAARDPDSTVMKILYLACQSLRPVETMPLVILVPSHWHFFGRKTPIGHVSMIGGHREQ